MDVIVTNNGFSTDTWSAETTLSISAETDPENLTLPNDIQRVVITFPNFADGRGFTLARLLRLRGYSGALRAKGPIISDQYAMARRSGFDEIAISQAQAVRQPEHDWLFRSNWTAHSYQSRLQASG
ncbi:MAG TPA: oxidoreductase [Rhodobacteraceae bacterium]|jgi:uncharacterized protein (DUF934 family)|nr:oxidoreductase [Paracoccaceae bacterium]